MNKSPLLIPILLLGIMCSKGTPEDPTPEVFDRKNLVAWCIVPFDAAQRGPKERASMLQSLGITKLAYDWRKKDIPTFDEEMKALSEKGIQLHAFWCPISSSNPLQEEHVKVILDLLERHKIETQIWVSLEQEVVAGVEGTKRLEVASETIRELALEAQRINCFVGLYNHGGWFGDPDNQIAIIESLKMPNIGIVYNFHHGHEQLDRFPSLFAAMQPYLLTVNVNGMKADGPKILTLGAGDMELEMLDLISKSGYSNPIGILDHQSERDSLEVLEENLAGLQALLERLARNTQETPVPAAAPSGSEN